MRAARMHTANSIENMYSAVLDEMVQNVTYRHKFVGHTDKRGLEHNVYSSIPTDRKELTKEIRKITEEEMIPHILSLAEQSKWTQWDDVIDLDLLNGKKDYMA